MYHKYKLVNGELRTYVRKLTFIEDLEYLGETECFIDIWNVGKPLLKNNIPLSEIKKIQ